MAGNIVITDGANPILGQINDGPQAEIRTTPVIQGDTEIHKGLNQLVSKVLNDYTNANTARIWQEQQVFVRALLNNRASYALNTQQQVQNAQRSQVFLHATRPRIQTAVALLMPIVAPPGENAWTIEADLEAIDPEEAVSLLQQGVPIEEIRERLNKDGDLKADTLEGKIEKGLDYTVYSTKLLNYTFDLCIFGTGILMGPFSELNPEASLVPVDEKIVPDNDELNKLFNDEKNKNRSELLDKLHEAGLLEKYLPSIQHVSPLELYPDPGATRVENARYIIVRKVFGKPEIQAMLEDDTFRHEEVEKVLNTYPDGIWQGEWWEVTLNTLNKQPNQSMPNGRYTCYQWWGFMTGKELNNLGLSIPKSRWSERVVVNAWIIGNFLVKCAVSDLHKDRLPFYVTPYSYVPHSFWGIGPSELLFDTQDGLNAMFRAMFDNLALASGPQMTVIASRLVNPDAAIEIRPWKIWQVQAGEAGETGNPIDFFTPESRLVDIRAAIVDLQQLAQEQTALPNFLMGAQTTGTHNRTFGGASLQFQNALTPLKTVIFNIESTQTIPMLTSMVRFFQSYSKDKRIQGKFRINAHGVRGLMAREAMLQKINDLMSIAGHNPQWSGRVKIQNVFSDAVRDIGAANRDWVRTEEEYEQIQQKEMQRALQEKAIDGAVQQTMQSAPKIRAEQSPRDAALELIKQSPENGPLKIALIQEALNMWNLSTPSVEEALQKEFEMQSISAINTAHEYGHNVGVRMAEPPPAHPGVEGNGQLSTQEP